MKKLYYWLVGHRTRITYWSCSEFSDKLRKWLGKEPKPKFVEFDPDTFKQRILDNKKDLDYWLNLCQDVCYFPHDVYLNIRCYIRNRYIDKVHYLQTKLKPGQWYDLDHRIVHGLFESLVIFVEQEKGHRWTAWDQNDQGNARENGLAYLDWEIGLGDSSPYQSKAAKEIKELYLWWVDVHSQRDEFDFENEKKHYKQDTEMLIRLINIRQSLWT